MKKVFEFYRVKYNDSFTIDEIIDSRRKKFIDNYISDLWIHKDINPYYTSLICLENILIDIL
jgi:hypothetical protein